MSPKVTIFDKLARFDICHAVIANPRHFLSSRDISVKDYCIIGCIKDRKCLRNFGFVNRPEYLSHRLVLEYDMHPREIKLFKDMLINKHEYVLVQQDDSGRVYEQAGISFRDYCLNTR